MKKSHGLIFITALLAVAVSFDLGSKHSWLGQAMEKGRASFAPGEKSPESSAGKAEAAPDKLRAEAREIWARMRGLNIKETNKKYLDFLGENDPVKRYRCLQAMGITLSRERFEQAIKSSVTRKQKIGWPLRPAEFLFECCMREWSDESPREAVAWLQQMRSRDTPRSSDFYSNVTLRDALCYSLNAVQRDPGSWAAFLKESSDPTLVRMSQALLREVKEPGSLWLYNDLEVNDLAVDYIMMTIDDGAYEMALKSLVKCPHEEAKMGIATSLGNLLSTDSLRKMAGLAQADDKDIANLYLSMAGDSKASYARAAFRLIERFSGGDSTEKALERVYSEWLKCGGLDEALLQAAKSGRYSHILMKTAVANTDINEEYLVRFLEGEDVSANDDFPFLHALLPSTPQSRKDDLFLAFYTLQHSNDHRAILESILKSPGIEDQVAASEGVLKAWSKTAPEEAAQWFQSLPSHGDLPELAVSIVIPWLQSDAEAAMAFIVAEDLTLDHSLLRSLDEALGQGKLSEPLMTKLLQHMSGKPEYQGVASIYADYLLVHDFPKGVQLFQAIHPGDWQTSVVNRVNTKIEIGYARVPRLTDLRTLDLSSVPAETIKVLNENFRKHALEFPEYYPTVKNP